MVTPPPKGRLPVVDEEPRGPVGWRVDGNLKLDAARACRGMWTRWYGTSCVLQVKMAWPRAEIEDRRGQAVGVHLRIAIDRARRRGRARSPKAKRDGLDQVAADVHQRPAADSTWLRMLAGFDVEVAEEAERRSAVRRCGPRRSTARSAQPLRMAANHEGLADLDAGAIADVEQRFGLGDGHAQIGFSQSTCLPASAALMVHGTCSWLGRGL